jgi:hypothetical protein
MIHPNNEKGQVQHLIHASRMEIALSISLWKSWSRYWCNLDHEMDKFNRSPRRGQKSVPHRGR